jgi:TPR repeat protein/photosystem II stability/assembly factor-like uncharacterized protein
VRLLALLALLPCVLAVPGHVLAQRKPGDSYVPPKPPPKPVFIPKTYVAPVEYKRGGTSEIRTGSSPARERGGTAVRPGAGRRGARQVERDERTAAERFEAACDGGEGAACGRLAELHQLGSGVTKDVRRAAALHERACNASHYSSCAALGALHEEGLGVARSAPLAAKLYALACDHQLHAACGPLARCYQEGRGVPRDLERATALRTVACTKGDDAESCYTQALLFHESAGLAAKARGRELGARARPLLQASCDRSVGRSCFMLATLLRRGVFLPPNLSLAMRLFQKACSDGVPESCLVLGRAYRTGDVVLKDEGRGLDLLCQGGEQAHCAAAAAAKKARDDRYRENDRRKREARAAPLTARVVRDVGMRGWIALPRLPSRVGALAGSPGHLYAATTNGLYHSTDAGATWSQTLAGNALAVLVAGPNDIWVGTPNAIFRGDGVTWTRRAVVSQHVTKLLRTAPGTIVALTYGGEVLRTTSGGARWTRSRPALLRELSSRAVNLGPVIITVSSEGLRRSEDGGATWKPLDLPDRGLDKTLGAAALTVWSPGGALVVAASCRTMSARCEVFRSLDKGRTWVSSGSFATMVLSDVEIGGASAEEFWVLASDTLMHTTTGGATWELSHPAKFKWAPGSEGYGQVLVVGRDVWLTVQDQTGKDQLFHRSR